jgi:hypothetical protein
MHRTRFLASTFALTALLATACSDSTLVAPSLDPASSPSAAGSPYGVDATVVRLAPGATHQLTAAKSANGQEVPTASIRWSSSDALVATVSSSGLVTAVAPGEAIITASRGSHAEQVTVIVDGCGLRALPMGTTTGEITTLDCYYAQADRYSDYFSVASTNGEVMRLATSGIAGIVGVKATTEELSEGTVYGSRNIGTPMRIISNGDPLQFYLSGQTATDLGAYSITRSIDTETHSCGAITFVVPGASFQANMQAANACHYNVAFTNYPPAMGKPLYAHRYWIRVDELKPYTVTVSGVSASFDPAVTIFPNIAGAPPVASALPGIDAPPPTRSVTFTPPALGYYAIEVSTGRFVVSGSTEEWVNHTGPFGVSVSR